ncbi:hypothetical protein [Legionella drancourtii]|uniref:Uncharacterized protein n=1 Tax=Legionella drancourtii LLAP12 TaxID=658187 RepID=G9ENH9_9GAMM|nr:hypothetical protein [Legionella drancourtii]EHL31340.1 hypothetical protein LDG_6802 [Legionella drancourtii LLAP12]
MILFNASTKWIAIAALNLALVVGMIFIIERPVDSTKDTEIISTRLNDIQSQLINLQKEVTKPSEKIDLSSINQDFNKLASLIEQLKSKDDQLLTDNRTELTHKLDAIHEVINTLDKKQNPVKYLPVSALPFKVLSIDSIQQVNVASVTYDFKTFPLEKGDKLIDWTVLNVDFGKQRLELENSKKEYVVVTLDTEQGDQNA